MNPISEQAPDPMSRAIIPQWSNKQKDIPNWSTRSLNDYSPMLLWADERQTTKRQREREMSLWRTLKLPSFWFSLFFTRRRIKHAWTVSWRGQMMWLLNVLEWKRLQRQPCSAPFLTFSLIVSESWILTTLWSPARPFFNLLCHIHFMQYGSRTAHQFWCLTAHRVFSWVYVERWAPSISFFIFKILWHFFWSWEILWAANWQLWVLCRI